MMTIEKADEALKNGFTITVKLEIKLLDARKRGYHKWINKEVHKEKGKVTYL